MKKVKGFVKQAHGLTAIFLVVIFGVFVSSLPSLVRAIGGSVWDAIVQRSTATEWIAEADRRFDLALSGREWWISLNSVVNLPFERQTSGAILGKNRELFYFEDSGSNLKQYLGEYRYEESYLQQYADIVQQTDAFVQKYGAKLTYCVIPNKENILVNQMPDDLVQQNSFNCTDQLMKYLQNHIQTELLYPKQALQQAAQQYSVWHTCDSHWNEVGGYMGMENWIRDKVPDWPELKDRTVKAEKESALKCEYNDTLRYGALQMLYLGSTVDTWYVEETPIDLTGYQDTLTVFENPDAPCEETVLVIGDSFRTSALASLTNAFRKICVIHITKAYGTGLENLLIETDPAYVLWIAVERNTASLPVLPLSK